MAWTNNSGNNDTREPASLPSRMLLTLFYLFFVFAGLLSGRMAVRQTGPGIEALGWKKIPCTIDESRIESLESSETPYRWVVGYRYFAGQEGQKEREWRQIGDRLCEDYDSARRLADRCPAGSRTTCIVDPDNPSRSFLERRFAYDAFGLCFAAGFFLVGAGGIFFAWRPGAKAAMPSRERRWPDSMTVKRTSPEDFWTSTIIIGTLFSTSLALACATTFKPLVGYLKSGNWRRVPCVVESSRVLINSDREGSSNKVDILFRYEINGVAYRSSRYAFRSNFISNAYAVVAAYPPGREAVCWVDPDDPRESVLVRNLPSDFFFGGVFLLFSLGVIVLILEDRRIKRIARERRTWSATGANPDQAAAPGPIVLIDQQKSARARLLVWFGFAVLWFGSFWTLAFFGPSAPIESRRIDSPGPLVAALLISSLILICFAVGGLAELRRPRLRALLDPGRLTIGGAARLEWNFSGPAGRLKSLRVDLEGAEHAGYDRGSDILFESSVFYNDTLVETMLPAQIASGSIEIALPKYAMHSFKAEYCKIVWTLKIEGGNPRRPSIKEECEIAVDPLPEV